MSGTGSDVLSDHEGFLQAFPATNSGKHLSWPGNTGVQSMPKKRRKDNSSLNTCKHIFDCSWIFGVSPVAVDKPTLNQTYIYIYIYMYHVI